KDHQEHDGDGGRDAEQDQRIEPARAFLGLVGIAEGPSQAPLSVPFWGIARGPCLAACAVLPGWRDLVMKRIGLILLWCGVVTMPALAAVNKDGGQPSVNPCRSGEG